MSKSSDRAVGYSYALLLEPPYRVAALGLLVAGMNASALPRGGALDQDVLGYDGLSVGEAAEYARDSYPT